MAWHHLVPRENALFYWPPQPRVVPCAHVIQRLLSEGKYPAGLINRKCVFLSASSQLMFHIFQWLWAESFGVLLGEPSVSVVARPGAGTELLSEIRPCCGGSKVWRRGEKECEGRRHGGEARRRRPRGPDVPGACLLASCLNSVAFHLGSGSDQARWIRSTAEDTEMTFRTLNPVLLGLLH